MWQKEEKNSTWKHKKVTSNFNYTFHLWALSRRRTLMHNLENSSAYFALMNARKINLWVSHRETMKNPLTFTARVSREEVRSEKIHESENFSFFHITYSRNKVSNWISGKMTKWKRHKSWKKRGKNRQMELSERMIKNALQSLLIYHFFFLFPDDCAEKFGNCFCCSPQ